MYVSAPTCFGYVSAVREQSRSRRARHTLQINLGLLALKNCINALHNNLAHTPYQDSKLTMLLQGPLPRLLDDRPSRYLRSCATHSARATAPSGVPILRANHCARNSPICLVMRVKRKQARLRRGVAGALGGNCKTLVVVTASPAAADTTETLQSLRFGEQCAKVRASACASTRRSLPSVCMPALAALIPASATQLTTGGECRKGDAARPRRRSGGD